MRSTTVPANRHCGSNQGTTHLGRCGAQTGAVCGGHKGALSGNMADTLCASGPKGRFLPARNTSGGILPGGGVEE